MKILAHRGFWMNESEKNSREAIKRAFDYGFGIETDLRDIFKKTHACIKHKGRWAVRRNYKIT